MWRWSLQKPVPIGANSLGRRQSRRLLVLPGRSASREYGLEADVGFGHFRGGFENRIQALEFGLQFVDPAQMLAFAALQRLD